MGETLPAFVGKSFIINTFKIKELAAFLFGPLKSLPKDLVLRFVVPSLFVSESKPVVAGFFGAQENGASRVILGEQEQRLFTKGVLETRKIFDGGNIARAIYGIFEGVAKEKNIISLSDFLILGFSEKPASVFGEGFVERIF